MDCLNHWIPAFAGMTGEVRIGAIWLPICVYHFVVIPAKAGIQEGDDGVPQETLIQSEIPCGIGICRPKSNNLAMT